MAAAVAVPNKKYVCMENVLNDINRRVISLQDKEIKRNNVIIGVVVDNIINIMKQKDHLFGRLFRDKFYGGSFYDNLKVGDPNEFDLDLILFLPVLTEPRINCSNQPGFVQVEVKEHLKILSRPEIEKAGYGKLSSLLEPNNCLSTKKFLKWMEGVINKAMNELHKDDRGTFIDAALDKQKPSQLSRIYAKIIKGAPAFTLKLTGKEEDGTEFNLDIDLVPCFQFDAKNWPEESSGYRTNPSSTKCRFLVVPKKPKEKHLENAPDIDTYWRLSFQEQERNLIGDGKKALKPSLRILKKIRDKHNHKIASYFIKTVYMWTVEIEPPSFWDQQLGVTVMLMLKKYEEYLRSNVIPYYWNRNYNLIGYLKDSTKLDIANTILKIIGDVDRNLVAPICDPYVIGKYLLSKDEFDKLKTEVKLGKKPEKQNQIATTQKILEGAIVIAPADSTTPPLVRLGFDSDSVEIGRKLSEIIENNNRKLVQDIMSQFSNNSSSEIVNLLKNIDEKVDKIAGKVANLEDKLMQVELENRQLRILVNDKNNGASDGTNYVDDFRTIRQIDSNNLDYSNEKSYN